MEFDNTNNRLWDPAIKPIIMVKTTDECGAFLNMARGYPINYDDREWLTSEHLYQAHRFEMFQCREFIRQQSNGYLAKQEMKRLREHYSYSEELWELVKVPIMEMCLQLKFEQHSGLGELLMSTYTKPIVEFSTKGDKFWGCEYDKPKFMESTRRLVGKNMLGKLLMKLRYELLNPPQMSLL